MKRFLIVLAFAALLGFSHPAAAETVRAEGGKVIYNVANRDFTLCADGFLNEEVYARLLQGYMGAAVQNKQVERYMQAYDVQNKESKGAMDAVIEQQKASMTAEELEMLYGPFKDAMTQEQFFKMHIMNATAIMTLMTQQVGPDVETMCRPRT